MRKPKPAHVAETEAGPIRAVALCALLVLATVAAYGRFDGFDFVNWDDNLYVTANTHVRDGLTLESVRWAITATDAHNWHPLTWISHMLDVELFGLDPVGHHRTSLGLHVATTVLLFLAFLRMTGAAGRSAFVAGLFALHPLHVESVAWVAERKDVLSALCFASVLCLYARYAERPSSWRYAGVVAAFAAGLTAKPMLVTLPAVLLLLDVWPLRRLRISPSVDLRRLGSLALEKLPLFALSAAASVMTIVAQKTAISLGARYTVSDRAGNALVSYVRYLANTLWPTDLSITYWHPGAWPAGKLIGAALVLAGITAAALRVVSTRPWFAVGWLWFLGMLVPVIGVVQVGEQAMADRYMYLPSIGLFVMLAWGVTNTRALALCALGLLLACGFATREQVRNWRSSDALWQHAHEVDPQNPLALEVLGVLAEKQGRQVEALGFYRRALEIDSRRQNAQYNLGNLLRWFGRPAEAIGPLLEAIRIRPDFATAYEALGHAYGDLGESSLSLEAFQRSIELDPKVANAHYNLGLGYLLLDRPGAALGPLREAVRLRPDFTLAFVTLGDAYAGLGDRKAAVDADERALALARTQGEHELASQIETHLARLRDAP